MINVNKRDFWVYVHRKLKRMINHYHIFAIISILFEEMAQDLNDGKEIKVVNFGTLMMKKMPTRLFYHVKLQQLAPTQGYPIMRFFLAPRIRKKICEALDITKIGHYDE